MTPYILFATPGPFGTYSIHMVAATNDVFVAGWNRSPMAATNQELVDALQAKLPTNQVGVFKGSLVA